MAGLPHDEEEPFSAPAARGKGTLHCVNRVSADEAAPLTEAVEAERERDCYIVAWLPYNEEESVSAPAVRGKGTLHVPIA